MTEGTTTRGRGLLSSQDAAREAHRGNHQCQHMINHQGDVDDQEPDETAWNTKEADGRIRT